MVRTETARVVCAGRVTVRAGCEPAWVWAALPAEALRAAREAEAGSADPVDLAAGAAPGADREPGAAGRGARAGRAGPTRWHSGTTAAGRTACIWATHSSASTTPSGTRAHSL